MRKQIYLDKSQAPAERLDTDYIQYALDQCKDWGGEVILGPGNWEIGSIRLYSDTTLRLQSGCHLMGSQQYGDYRDWGFESTLGYLKDPEIVRLWQLPPDYVTAMITAVDAENVAVIGELGTTINGQDCRNPRGEEGFRGPMGMVFCRCRQVTLRGYTFTRCGNWAHQLDSCNDILMDDVRVLGGHDGINLHHSRNILLRDCDFRTGDDCVAGYHVENLRVQHCYLNTACNCFRLGCKNLQVEGCRFWGPGEYPHQISGRHNTLFAFNYYAFSHDICEESCNWVISDCIFEDIDSFMHLNYGNCWDHDGAPFRDLTLYNCTMTGILNGSRIRSTVPMDVNLTHVRCQFRSGIPETGICDTSSQVTFHLRDVHIVNP